MEKTTAIMDLVAGYETYSGVEELNVTAALDAPATSAPCAAASVSWLVSQFSAKTIDGGC